MEWALSLTPAQYKLSHYRLIVTISRVFYLVVVLWIKHKLKQNNLTMFDYITYRKTNASNYEVWILKGIAIGMFLLLFCFLNA